MAYGAEYSDENIKKMTDLYSQSQQSSFDRARAQLMTSLGGNGNLYGTGYMNKGGQLAGQLAGNVAGYEAGLRGKGLDVATQERQTAEQRAYETPFTMANLTGYLPGSSGTYDPSSGWNWSGGQTGTLQGRQYTEMTPYQQAMATATGNQQSSQDIQSILSALMNFGGITGVLQRMLTAV
jgi:hypothetical protein